jgi:sulfur-oxidizing protein SoxB
VWDVVEQWLKAQGGRIKPRPLNTPKIIGALPNPGYAS